MQVLCYPEELGEIALISIKVSQDKLFLIYDDGKLIKTTCRVIKNGTINVPIPDPKEIKNLPIVFSPLLDRFRVNSCFSLSTDNQVYFIGGQWDNSLLCTYTKSGENMKVVDENKSVTSCLSLSEDGSILGVGSFDTTCLIWDTKTILKENDAKPLHIFYGHDKEINCININLDMDVVITGSDDKTCIVHDLTRGQYIRSISYDAPVKIVKISNFGLIVTYCENDQFSYLYLHTINGNLVNKVGMSGEVNDIVITECGNFIVHAGNQGSIIARSLYCNTLNIVQEWQCIDNVRCLAVLSRELIGAGLESGALAILHLDIKKWEEMNDSMKNQ